MTAAIKEKKFRPAIIALSVLIPLVVALLYISPRLDLNGVDLGFLPLLNAIINGTTSVVLLFGFFAIKNKNIGLHKKLMTTAIALSVVFLLSYVFYHMTTESTTFGGDGPLKYIYYFILLTHIVLAVVIVPLVLITYVRALAEKFDKHRKIARWTLPVWLYVSVTGVLVYILISPYYS